MRLKDKVATVVGEGQRCGKTVGTDRAISIVSLARGKRARCQSQLVIGDPHGGGGQS